MERNGFSIVTKGDTSPFPDEVEDSEKHPEGAIQKVLVNRFERDAIAREKSVAHHGCRCLVCGFDFRSVYGELGDGFIHLHHLVPISSIGRTYLVDPLTDLKPVCPNCQAMLHKRHPPYSIEELRAILVREQQETRQIPSNKLA